jgi:hypothetical protein
VCVAAPRSLLNASGGNNASVTLALECRQLKIKRDVAKKNPLERYRGSSRFQQQRLQQLVFPVGKETMGWIGEYGPTERTDKKRL